MLAQRAQVGVLGAKLNNISDPNILTRKSPIRQEEQEQSSGQRALSRHLNDATVCQVTEQDLKLPSLVMKSGKGHFRHLLATALIVDPNNAHVTGKISVRSAL